MRFPALGVGFLIRSVLLASVAALAFLLAPSEVAQATFPGSNGKIAFERFSNLLSGGVFVANSDGTDEFKVAPGTSPEWSPDGKKLLYEGFYLRNVSVANADGSGVKKLLDAVIADPGWSPDGQKIIFDGPYGFYGAASNGPCGGAISVANADGSGQRIVLSGWNQYYFHPRWSPDGRIAFARADLKDVPDPDDPEPGAFICEAAGGGGIFVMNPDGTGLRRIYIGADFDWSPDGHKLVWTSYDSMYWTNIDTGQVKFVTDHVYPSPAPSPVWSPDGTKIVFNRYDIVGGELVGLPNLYTINPDGTGLTQLTSTGRGFHDVSWQPIPNRPPDCSHVSATPQTLWPPNHRLVPVGLSGATDPDGDSVTLTITGVSQDEVSSGSSDSALGPGGDQVSLRAERSGAGDGRVYRIAFRVSDSRGGFCSGTATVAVPHNQGQPVIDSAPPS